MQEHESSTSNEQVEPEDEASHSLKEKINKIDFRKWAKRAAVAGVTLIVAGVVVSVTRNKPEIEE